MTNEKQSWPTSQDFSIFILGVLATGSLTWYASGLTGWPRYIVFALAFLLALRIGR